jgi:hypothetical protein
MCIFRIKKYKKRQLEGCCLIQNLAKQLVDTTSQAFVWTSLNDNGEENDFSAKSAIRRDQFRQVLFSHETANNNVLFLKFLNYACSPFRFMQIFKIYLLFSKENGLFASRSWNFQ